MVRGLYTACTGMINEQNRMDILTNNLANSTTNGYKKEGSTSEAFSSLLAYRIKDQTGIGVNTQRIGSVSLGVKIGEGYTDYTQGSFKQTDNTFDLALSGDGFFSVEFTNKAGETSTKYTRDGSFTMNQEGYLVNTNGDYLLGTNENGATVRIQVDPNATITIDKSGLILENGVPTEQLLITNFADYNYLEKYGENYYQAVEGAEMAEPDVQVYQGYLEASNVSIVTEMVDMISVTRAYETNQKVIQTMDTTLDIAVNQIGKVR